MKPTIEELRSAISLGDEKKACAIFLTGLTIDPEEFLQKIRSKGVFRYANYGFQTRIILQLLEISLATKSGKLSENTTVYLESVRALACIADPIRSLLKKIKSAINARSFKSYLVTLDNLFLTLPSHTVNEIRSDASHFCKEELAAAFSYYYFLLCEKNPPTEKDVNFIIEKKIGSDYYLETLVNLAKIIQFREGEFLVEVFDYRARRDGLNVDISPPNERLEMSMRWGYIYAEEQQRSDVEELHCQKIPSIIEEAGKIIEKHWDKFFEIKRQPIERIISKLPLSKPFIDLVAGDALTLEDCITINNVEKSFFIPWEKIKSIEIYKSITLFDLIKFQRLWFFLMGAFKKFCEIKNLNGTLIYYRSLLLVFYKGEAYQGIVEIFGQNKVDELFEIFTWDYTQGKVFDIQYTPTIKIGKAYTIPLGMMATSQITRNALQSTHFRFDASGKDDLLGSKLVEALSAAKIEAKARVPYTFQGFSGEIDVLAHGGNTLFAFECKNSLHPCSPFELRQSYDYLIKGFEQLTRFRTLISHPQFVELLRKKPDSSWRTLKGLLPVS